MKEYQKPTIEIVQLISDEVICKKSGHKSSSEVPLTDFTPITK